MIIEVTTCGSMQDAEILKLAGAGCKLDESGLSFDFDLFSKFGGVLDIRRMSTFCCPAGKYRYLR